MPLRETPIKTGKIFHVFNKTLDEVRVFEDSFYCYYFMKIAYFYRSQIPKISYSTFRRSTNLNERLRICKILETKNSHRLKILAYCLMPNHYHFLLKQTKDQGIEQFISNITNSMTRYYNTKHERMGPIFLPRFKAVEVGTVAQLIHVSRYIHLNPFSSEIVKNLSGLHKYPWSSYSSYLDRKNDKIRLVDCRLILDWFSRNKEDYRQFVDQHAQYQRYLEKFK